MNELNHVLVKITALQNYPEPYVLKQLVDLLRFNGKSSKSAKIANEQIKMLIDNLRENPEHALGLSTFILTLLNTHHKMSIFTDTGISNYGFLFNLFRLIGHRFIPLLPDDDNIIELVDYIFDDRNDQQWLDSVESKYWLELISILSVPFIKDSNDSDFKLDDNLDTRSFEQQLSITKNNITKAIVILSYRINGLGLHQDLMKAYPEMLKHSDAFIAQNKEALLFAEQYRNKHSLEGFNPDIDDTEPSIAPMLVMLDQCDKTVNTIRKRIYKTGISIRLTNMLLRLEQSISRLHNLGELLSNDSKVREQAIKELAQAIILSVKRRYSIRYLISINTQLLSRKITENAGRVGEHYISTDKSGFKKMFKMAAVGGFVIAFMATLKLLAYDLDLAPMGEAFVYSMIYGLGFVFIHIIHGTVATKQPAMTAAAIASTISTGSGKKSHQLAKLSELMVDILRTQFIAILGNVLIAMPLALAISFVWLQINGEPIIDIKQSKKLIEELNPLTSLALLHAAIAGVYLFLAGLIAGFYDNLAVFNHIGERISRHYFLRKIMSKKLSERLGRFIEANLGAIMGNFMFGVFLGSTATIGYLFGLPLDIRHIAFSSANFAHGIFNMPLDSVTFSIVFISLAGVILIGVINLLVSFSLALIVALRSKGVKFQEWKTLGGLVWSHFMTHTRDFFWPRPEPMKYSHLDSSGQIIHEDNNKQSTKDKSKTWTKAASSKPSVADIRVIPENVSIDKGRIDYAKNKKILNEKIKDPKTNEVNPKPGKNVVLTDTPDVNKTDSNKTDNKYYNK